MAIKVNNNVVRYFWIKKRLRRRPIITHAIKHSGIIEHAKIESQIKGVILHFADGGLSISNMLMIQFYL
jgi:hypothetical protein